MTMSFSHGIADALDTQVDAFKELNPDCSSATLYCQSILINGLDSFLEFLDSRGDAYKIFIHFDENYNLHVVVRHNQYLVGFDIRAQSLEENLRVKYLNVPECTKVVKESTIAQKIKTFGYLHYTLDEPETDILLLHCAGVLDTTPNYEIYKWLVDYFNSPPGPFVEEEYIPRDEKYSHIEIVTKGTYGFETKTKRFEWKKFDEDYIKTFYGADGWDNYRYLLDMMNDPDEANFVILYGTPGTGKSSILYSLCAEDVERRAIFCPKHQSTVLLSSPEFSDFVETYVSGKALILEDAEALLTKKEGVRTAHVSTLLDFTSGFSAKLFSPLPICTINYEEDIDQALLRDGRLSLKWDFRPLVGDEVNQAFEYLDSPLRVGDTDIRTVAQIYSSINK
jgi:hypothetical protein